MAGLVGRQWEREASRLRRRSSVCTAAAAPGRLTPGKVPGGGGRVAQARGLQRRGADGARVLLQLALLEGEGLAVDGHARRAGSVGRLLGRGSRSGGSAGEDVGRPAGGRGRRVGMGVHCCCARAAVRARPLGRWHATSRPHLSCAATSGEKQSSRPSARVHSWQWDTSLHCAPWRGEGGSEGSCTGGGRRSRRQAASGAAAALALHACSSRRTPELRCSLRTHTGCRAEPTSARQRGEKRRRPQWPPAAR